GRGGVNCWARRFVRLYTPGLPRRKFRPRRKGCSAWPHDLNIQPESTELSEGVEILKLHGSNNWMQGKRGCRSCGKLTITTIEFKPSAEDTEFGYIDRRKVICAQCSNYLTPFIVPPTWAKDIDHPIPEEELDPCG